MKINPGRLEMGGMTYQEQYEAAEALRKVRHLERLRLGRQERRRQKKAASAKPDDGR